MKVHFSQITKISLVALAITTFSVVWWFGVAQTQAVTNTVDKQKIINGSVYSAGEKVTINGTVNGDVHCAAQEVVIDGTVNGDVLCAAQKLTIRGEVSGSVRAAAQDMRLEGKIGHGMTLAAEKLRFTRSATLGQDATIFGNDVIIDGKIGRDITASGNLLGIGTEVGRNVAFNGSQLIMRDDAVIKGSVRYESRNSISIGDQAVIVGNVTREKPNEQSQNRLAIIMAIVMISLYLFALLLVLVWPQKMHAVSSIAVQGLGKVLLTGIVAALVMPIAITVIAATIIGVPIALFLLFVGLLLLLLSGPITAYYLGSMLLPRSKNAIAIMAVGATVLLVVYSIPIAGGIALVFSHIIGSGALILALIRRTGKPDYRVE